MRFVFCFITFVAPFSLANAADQICQKWFAAKHVHSKDMCILVCASSPITDKTLHCRGQCDALCDSSLKERFFFQLSDLYPGLTDSERALASKEPVKMLEAYKLSVEAETICLNRFPASDMNDGSDACRHFVWAILLAHKYSESFANQVLTAHEDNRFQPSAEKQMDEQNNKHGLEVSRGLSKKSDLTTNIILNLFDKAMKDGKLKVIGKPK